MMGGWMAIWGLVGLLLLVLLVILIVKQLRK